MSDRDTYTGRMLRVNLSTGQLRDETVDPVTMRQYVGGTGLGAKILYEEVPPGVEWNDPRNRLIVGSGPLGGTRIMGSGTISIVTKGPLTNGATSTQANGYLGAFMRFNGYDAIVVEGASPRWVYLCLADGKAELQDAAHLVGKDTWDTQEALAVELGKREQDVSAFSVGPAGEHLVKFASIAGDHGHVAGHNGAGAVMGSKRLKAFVAVRTKGEVRLNDPARLGSIAREITESIKTSPATKNLYEYGTGMLFTGAHKGGYLPVKNYTTNLFPDTDPFMAVNYRPAFGAKLAPCWACQMHHLNMLKVTEGPYAGYVGEEPEYEQWAAWGPVIGNTDPAAALVLSNETDRLGLENNEAGWMIAWVMECFEKGLVTAALTDGLRMNWGNVDAARALLHKIARREGFGDVLAEGIMRASRQLGGEAAELAIYTLKGNTPRGHDHRGRWFEMLDTAVSNTGTIEAGPPVLPQELGLTEGDAYGGRDVSTFVAKTKGRRTFEDCLGVCCFCTRTQLKTVADALNAATGWDVTTDEAMDIGRRAVNVLRAFNVRHGITPDVEKPSLRYGSVPADGPVKGKGIGPEWDGMLDNYYHLMGWDRWSGKPLPETLKKYGLERQLADLW